MSAPAPGGRQSLPDALLPELIDADGSESMIDLCLSGNMKKIAAVPLRCRLIALSLLKGLSPEEANAKLASGGCPQLYARNLREATVMYALNHHIPYEEWKSLEKSCTGLLAEISSRPDELSASVITHSGIRSYVRSSSANNGKNAETLHITRELERNISSLGEDELRFRLFLQSNIQSFSTVREKVRYYFCKYLLFFLDARTERVADALAHGKNVKEESVREALSVFKVRTELDRRRHSPEEARHKMEESPVSLSRIYRAFESFYFGYPSLDWFHVQIERYGDPDRLGPADRSNLADSIRTYSRAARHLSDDSAIAWLRTAMEQEEEKTSRLSGQAGRSGENFLRRALRGDIDLDRTTLAAFLLFFDRDAGLEGRERITETRLNEILTECGFPALREEVPCDRFFIGFLDAVNPDDYLMEEAEMTAFSEENFYLYKTWLASVSYDGEFEKYLE